MADAPQRLLRAHAEVVVAGTRVGIAALVLFSIWLDPSEPATNARLTYLLHSAYVAYAAVLAVYTWRRGLAGWFPIITHAIDIVAFSIFQYLTLGSSSPLFIYFIFVLFGATIRWGWRGTLATTPPLLAAYLVMGLSMSLTAPSAAFEMNRFVIRVGYLIMVAGLLVYLGLHEAKLRQEIEQLARWPALGEGDLKSSTTLMLAHAASIVGASSAVAAWSDEEPHTVVASWREQASTLASYSPEEIDAIVPETMSPASFVASAALPPRIAERLGGGHVVSSPFRTERVSGRLFFAGIVRPTTSIVPVVELVAREFGASVDQFAIRTRQRQLAIGEDRVRVARDLHDGVLQALTGVRLELQGIATTLDAAAGEQTRDRLLALERALAIEQRELRKFIEGLRPFVRRAATGGLAERLEELRERLALQWKVPIDIRASGSLSGLPAEIEGAVPQMVHEAVVNAVKHGQPSRIAVDLREDGERLVVTVSDDGRGFPLHGRFDHQALMDRNIGPRSLCERVASLGGDVSIDSGSAGARVEMSLPLARAVV